VNFKSTASREPEAWTVDPVLSSYTCVLSVFELVAQTVWGLGDTMHHLFDNGVKGKACGHATYFMRLSSRTNGGWNL